MIHKPKDQFLKISRFDSTEVQAAYPNITAIQLEPGPVEGWIRSVSVGPLQVNAGTLNRTTLYEGMYTQHLLELGFILDTKSTAIVRAHEYDAGALALNVGQTPMHEVFPGHMIWVGIYLPESMLAKELKTYGRILRENKHLILEGPRKELEPLIDLIHHCLDQTSPFNHTEAERLSKRFLEAIEKLFSSRLQEKLRDTPYTKGDLFLKRMVETSHHYARETQHKTLKLEDLCKATGMKSRTLQKNFNDLYGMGPIQYFRVRRLNEVRADLIKAEPSTSTVHDIAGNLGFTHMGHLGSFYKKMFGETPSKTLVM